MVHAPFTKWDSFKNSRKDGKFSIDLVDSMLNTRQTLELTNVSQLFTSIWKHWHTQWSPNIIPWFMYESIVKYAIQGTECIKQGMNLICAKFYFFPKSISWKEQVSFLSIWAPTITQVPKYIGKATTCTLYAISQHKM